MVSLKKALSSSVAALAVTATIFVGSAPAQAHDGRNAALIGGLVVGALVGSALASDAQAYEPAPADRSYYHYPAYVSSYYSAPRHYYSGYDQGYYAPQYRYRHCDHGYRRVSGWDDDED
jgi:hypothetical protein